MHPKLEAWAEGRWTQWPEGFTSVNIFDVPTKEECERFAKQLPPYPNEKYTVTCIQDDDGILLCAVGDLSTSEISEILTVADRFGYKFTAEACGERAKNNLRPLLARFGMKGLEISHPATVSTSEDELAQQKPKSNTHDAASDKIRFRCPHCDKSVSVSVKHAGKRGKCPGCSATICIPSG